jgi:lipoate-protein ligase A
MESWRLIDLGRTEPLAAQTFYEAVALAISRGLSPNTLLLCQPASSYVCLGFHQDLEREIDVEYCGRMGLPIIRRSQGGGATYLNSDQIFYQVVARKESIAIPPRVEDLFEKFLRAPVQVYRRLGLPAEFKPVNDVVVRGRKISGNGAGLIDSTVVLVGNIILDLDYDAMSHVLRVPNEKFRDKMAKSMSEWVTSLKREMGYIPEGDKVKRLLMEAFEQVLEIRLQKAEPHEEERRIWEEDVKPKHLSLEWLQMKGARSLGDGWRTVKIAGNIHVAEVDHKAGKLIRIRAELRGQEIQDISITGDFFMIPEEAVLRLQEALIGADLEETDLEQRIGKAFKESKVQIPGMHPRDFIEAILELKEVFLS